MRMMPDLARHALLAAVLILAPAIAAATCPAPPDRTEERAALLATLAEAPDPGAGQRAADAVWRFWTVAPDLRSQRLLDDGMRAIRLGRVEDASRALDDLVAWCPGFPEGWNQRAILRFLRGDLEGSLADIDRTLALEPAHFGAMAGQLRILLAQGRVLAARGVLRAALKIHPWMAERALLDTQGDDI